jgi:hypothetical protein
MFRSIHLVDLVGAAAHMPSLVLGRRQQDLDGIATRRMSGGDDQQWKLHVVVVLVVLLVHMCLMGFGLVQ